MPTPVVTAISPDVLLAGVATQNVQVTGMDLNLVTALSVFQISPFIEQSCTITSVIDPTTLKVTFPAMSSGASSLGVTHAEGTYTSIVPLVYSEIVPLSGNELTGKRVTVVSGATVNKVTFGGINGLDPIVDASGTFTTIVTPPLKAGAVTVKVYDGSGVATTLTDQYTFSAVASKYTASMKTLLVNLKDLFNQFKVEGGWLDDVQQIKRGLRPNNVLPVICMVPTGTSVVQRFSDGKVDLLNSITISIFTKLIDKHDAQDDVMQLEEKIKQILKYYHPIQAGAKNTFVMAAPVGQTAQTDTGLLRKASVQIQVTTTRTQLPTSLTQSWTQTEPVDILTTIYNTVKSYSATDLNQVNTRMWLRGATDNIGFFPALSVILEDDTTVYEWRGKDKQDRMVTFEIYDKLTSKDDSMDTVLDIVDALMLVIWKNVHWGGTAENSDLESISYGMADGEKGLLSVAEVRMSVASNEAVSRNQV